jgi:hypothetical protein
LLGEGFRLEAGPDEVTVERHGLVVGAVDRNERQRARWIASVGVGNLSDRDGGGDPIRHVADEQLVDERQVVLGRVVDVGELP